jgi:hypothetical protein
LFIHCEEKRMRNRKRLVIALIVGVAVFAAAFGMANTLGGLTSDSLGADDQTVGTCDSNGVSTSYTTDYDAAAPAGFKVVAVTVSGIANTCDGKTIEVALSGSGGTLIEEQTDTVPTDAATSVALTFSDPDSLAESVLGVHVMISGTP